MKNLFTVSQVTKSCGISRATLLRLEKRGLLQPVFVDKKSGYRYYDNHDVTRILQIKHLLDIGLSYDGIYEYFNTNGTSEKLLNSLEVRMNAAKRMYDEMKLRIENKHTISFEIISLPEYTCYAKEYSGSSLKEKYDAMYALYHEVIEKGLRPLASEPLFSISKNIGLYKKKEDFFTCCIPLEPDSSPNDALVLKSCRAFSCLYCGSYDRFSEVWDLFAHKVREQKVIPIGYPRVLGIVAPYTAREFTAENYVSRIAIPIADSEDESKSI